MAFLVSLITSAPPEYTGTCTVDTDCYPNTQQKCSDFGYCMGPNKEWQCPNGLDSECPSGWKCSLNGNGKGVGCGMSGKH
ncbi:unnamed protein product, partial [Mesorhabditis belari]|uniref:Uncharacterized protein n=1 Tax=Mesorhabditis belari TaxID=2138241 RepID=A0AAF3EQM3_9BILA